MSLGPAEILVILVVALVVLGPSKLPEAARQVGKAMAEFRRVSAGFQAEVRDAFQEPTPPPAAVPSIEPVAPVAPVAPSEETPPTRPGPQLPPEPPAH